MVGAHPFDWVDYGDSGIVRPVDQVIAGMDFGLPEVEVVPVPFRMLPGTGITPAHWFDLAAEVRRIAGLVQGVVITHGTATLEDTAFFLRASLDPQVSVVVCGSQRPPNTASSDAVSGLRNALVAAAEAPPGVHVVMDGKLFSPDDVTKTANHALDAFEAPEFGPLGRIEAGGRLSLRRLPRPAPHVFDLGGIDPETLPRVDLVQTYPGADGVVIDALVAAGTRGIVNAGFPPGRATPSERTALLRAVGQGVTVVQSSRAFRGHVPVQAYNTADGILSGGSLSASKARILLMLALATRLETARLQSLLQDW